MDLAEDGAIVCHDYPPTEIFKIGDVELLEFGPMSTDVDISDTGQVTCKLYQPIVRLYELL